jgi:D-alanine-D-alanine ligase-like ATP-grasp enzyme
MPILADFRAGKPAFYPDQSIYAEYACAAFGLAFDEIDGGTGLVFTVGSPASSVAFGAGRGSFFPQNTATAATLATDKYFAKVILGRAGIATLGGQYVFLHQRHRAHRPPGHERADATAFFHRLGGRAFIKPLAGSRGDFAQPITSEAALADYLDDVAQYYDAVLLQPIVEGREYRIFVLDDAVVYCARKMPPFIVGDGRRTIAALLAERDAALQPQGISSSHAASDIAARDVVLPAGEHRAVTGRMNRSAGGAMTFESPRNEAAAVALAVKATKALGLRAAAIDLFTDIGGDPDDIRVIEVNANPSIRFLEDSGRDDLILTIWRHTFAAMGLLDV